MSSWEINHLKQFLNSPFFNRREDIIVLFDILLLGRKDLGLLVSKKEAFSKIYPKQQFDEQKMYLLISYLAKLIEKFLAFREFDKDKHAQFMYRAKAFKILKREKEFLKTIKEGQKILEKKSLRDSHYLRQIYNFEFELYNSIYSQTRIAENNLETVGKAFDTLYIAEKLKQFCSQLSHQNVFQKEYDLHIREIILQQVETSTFFLNEPAIEIYYFCFKAIATEDEVFFKKLRLSMQKNYSHFSPSEMRNIYMVTINFCIKRMNTGREQFIKEGFDLYKEGIEKKFLIENGEMTRFTFSNVVSLGLKLEQFEWVEYFIFEYSSLLPAVYKTSIHNYALSRLRYEQKKYKEAMLLLARFETTDSLLFLDAKLTLLFIYYELGEVDPFESLLESMRLYIQRKSGLGYHQAHYKNVLRLMKQLLRLNNEPKKKQQFVQKVTNLKVNRIKDWFLAQLEKS